MEKYRLEMEMLAVKEASEVVKEPAPAVAASVPPPPKRASSDAMIRVARDGADWGEVKMADVQAWLGQGDLTTEDHYFDPEQQQWLTLGSHPKLTVSKT